MVPGWRSIGVGVMEGCPVPGWVHPLCPELLGEALVTCDPELESAGWKNNHPTCFYYFLKIYTLLTVFIPVCNIRSVWSLNLEVW